MSLCAACGVLLVGDVALCDHHALAYAESWATTNRIVCDFVHRGVAPARLSATERDDDDDIVRAAAEAA